MALDADGHGDAVAGVDHARVLAGADQHPRALGGQAAQVQPGRLVRAVLAPHHRVQGQLEVVGGPAEDLADGLELVVGQAEGPVQRLAGGGSSAGGWSGGSASAEGVMVPSTIEGGAASSRQPERRGAQPGRSARTTTRSRSDHTAAASKPGVGQPAQLVGQRGGPVVAGGHRGHGVGRVDGDHHVAEHEAPAGAQDAGDAGEEVRLVRPLQVVDGQRRDDEVEGAAGQRVGQVGHPELDARRRPGAARAAASMALVLVDPDRGRPGVAASTAASVSPVPVPRSSTDDTARPAARRGRPPPGGARRRGPPSRISSVGGRVEVELAHAVGTSWELGSSGIGHGIGSCRRGCITAGHEAGRRDGPRSSAARRAERPSVTRLMTSSITPLAPLPHTPCCRS